MKTELGSVIFCQNLSNLSPNRLFFIKMILKRLFILKSVIFRQNFSKFYPESVIFHQNLSKKSLNWLFFTKMTSNRLFFIKLIVKSVIFCQNLQNFIPNRLFSFKTGPRGPRIGFLLKNYLEWVILFKKSSQIGFFS